MFVKLWDREICIACLTCVKVCPNDNLIEFNHKPTRAKVNTCTGCNHCTVKCPSGAIYHVYSGEDAGYGHWDPARIRQIQRMAASGKHIVEGKGSTRRFPDFDDLVFLPAQIDRKPLLESEPVHTGVVIGPMAKKPMRIQTPIMIGAMSFGALSKEAKIALARGSAAVGTAANSGEGGMLPEERAAAHRYILQYSTGRFGIREETLRQADAIEIKIAQGAKPGMGGHLLGPKVTLEIATIRGIEPGRDAISPARHLDIDSPADLGRRIEELREITGGVPIGIKMVGGHVEQDLAHIVNGTICPDFLVIDGGEGGTGAAPVIAKDHVALPLIHALTRAADILAEHGLREKITLIAAGGLRTATDFGKVLALGAQAVYTAGAVKIAMGCIYCRACHTGKCPTGICTQNRTLRERYFDGERAAKGVQNFLTVATEDIATLTRIVGKADVAELNRNDLFALDACSVGIAGVRQARPQGYPNAG